VVHYPERSFTDGARVSNLIPDARLVVREGANGPLLNPDLPELFELVLDFIQEHASSGAVGGSDSAVQATSVVLTPQQLVVLRRVAAGDTDPEIAEALGIQPSTVSRHVHHILRKVGARNRAEAVSWGFTNHVLPG
jgi:DNA-binding NarL/FixJ family response regulator